MAMKSRALVAGTVGLLALAASAKNAEAQQKTFKLDRFEMAGAPEDGLGLFRPVTNQRTIFYGQLGVGYQLNPLRTSTVTSDQLVQDRSKHAVVANQLAVYGNAGFELFDRATVGVAFPWYPAQNGDNPSYTLAGGVPVAGTTKTTSVKTGGPGAGDIRLDLRGVILRSEDRKSALGAMVNVFFPSGSTDNFGGDDKASVMAMVTAETKVKFLILAANTGFAFRPRHSMNDPVANNGLGIGNEWRWNVGAFIPFKDGKYRLGGTIFGQTGIEKDDIIGQTAFTKRNSPIEFNIEGRMRFGPADHWYVGAGGGSSILRGYGAPDLRLLGVFGLYIPILDTDPKSPDKKADMKKWRQEHVGDRDHDGIPDDVDACPDDPEDHLGNDPNDGCPMPKDRDGDGIPDQFDKCPDQPEDKDGIDDGDGCPEDDVDNDSVPDAVDACPKVPGKPNKIDPKRNGCPTTIDVDESGNIKVLQRVQFQVGTATILPDSFPILQEVADYLKATPGIKKMAVEGHTDNTGSLALNKSLSQQRAEACMKWLVAHGIAADRLQAKGYGPDKPLVDNDTPENRAKNRRTEFNIVQQDSK
jgi:outer membrane protein OmpA-like peptidoglycan-associated protein